MAGVMTSDNEEFKDFKDFTASDVRSARRADASSSGHGGLAPSPLTGDSVRLSARGASTEQDPAAVDHQRVKDELRLMKALCQHLSYRLTTCAANHIEWPIDMEEDRVVGVISIPNISDKDTAMSLVFGMVSSTDSTWILPVGFIPVIYELYTKHILPNQPEPFKDANLVFLARVLGLDKYLPAYSHKLNVDTKVVVDFWAKREVNDKSKPMTGGRITKAAIRLAIAHETIIKKSFNYLFTTGMKTLRKSTTMTADEAWKIIRSYKRLRPSDASDPRESSSPASSDLIRSEEGFHVSTKDAEPDSTSPDHRLTAGTASALVTSSKRHISISSDEGDSATLKKDSSKGKEGYKRTKLDTAT